VLEAPITPRSSVSLLRIFEDHVSNAWLFDPGDHDISLVSGKVVQCHGQVTRPKAPVNFDIVLLVMRRPTEVFRERCDGGNSHISDKSQGGGRHAKGDENEARLFLGGDDTTRRHAHRPQLSFGPRIHLTVGSTRTTRLLDD
jgi:hypothetical protein